MSITVIPHCSNVADPLPALPRRPQQPEREPCAGHDSPPAGRYPIVRSKSDTDRSDTDRSDTDRSDTDRSDTDRSDTDEAAGAAQRPIGAVRPDGAERDTAR
ncbi:hypothetical protein Acsp04_53410 [Actinomadura sp. NBRC 104425]|nr:hypothetical protein Acsp04_53410 [Actinomadura sp. NBRC 104425]